MRFAVIVNPRDSVETVTRYLPSNYSAAKVDSVILIAGEDQYGWTLDGYVIPRLASGLIYAIELVANTHERRWRTYSNSVDGFDED